MGRNRKVYTPFGIASKLDFYHPVYKPCRTGGYNNTGFRVGDRLKDGRELVMGKKIGWREVWAVVYAVRAPGK